MVSIQADAQTKETGRLKPVYLRVDQNSTQTLHPEIKMPLNEMQASISKRLRGLLSDDVTARLLISLYFQDFVNEGLAKQYLDDDGHTEIHLASGEIFLLAEAAITRMV